MEYKQKEAGLKNTWTQNVGLDGLAASNSFSVLICSLLIMFNSLISNSSIQLKVMETESNVGTSYQVVRQR